MNHYAARQRESGRWDYTCGNRRTGVHAVGYCAKWLLPKLEAGEALPAGFANRAHYERYRQLELRFYAQYHEDGHASAEEACACYRRFLLDHSMRLEVAGPETEQHRCQFPGCEAWTQTGAAVGYGIPRAWWLCAEHRTREGVEQMMPPIGEAWSSY